MNTKTNSHATSAKASFSFINARRLNGAINPTASTIGVGMARRRLLTLQNLAGLTTMHPILCAS